LVVQGVAVIGEAYWTTGIVLKYHERDWSLHLDFLDNGWCQDASTQGTLALRYRISTEKLPAALDTLIADAKRLGITFRTEPDLTPTLYVPGDGENTDETYHPDWRRIVARQCHRLGWRDVYGGAL
jgi:hypothetical protein